MNVPDLPFWLKQVQEKAQQAKQRFLIAIVGDETYAATFLDQTLQALKQTPINEDEKGAGWYAYSAEYAFKTLSHAHQLISVEQQTYRHKLGSEVDGLIFQDQHFNVDAFAALSGTVKAGGGCVVVFPKNFSESSLYKQSLFLQRFWATLGQCSLTSELCFVVDSTKALPKLDKPKPFDSNLSTTNLANVNVSSSNLINSNLINSNLSSTNLPRNEQEINPLTHELLSVENHALAQQCKTPEQITAVNAVINVVKGHRNRPLVLTADRGRGKSSALAIACAQLLLTKERHQQPLHIVITAPNISNVDIFFTQLQSSLSANVSIPENDVGEENLFSMAKHCLTHAHGNVEYKAIEQLIKEALSREDKKTQSPSLLLVDEAAGFPIPLLLTLCKHYHRLVFSSTVHGYEGAGRGFSVKFLTSLKAEMPQTKSLHLKQAIRWSEGDSLEQFVFDSCLLNAQSHLMDSAEMSKLIALSNEHYSQAFEFNCLDKLALLNDDALLKQVYALLVTAHYQTSPNDLKMMLDNEYVDILTLSYNQPSKTQTSGHSTLKNRQHIIAVALVINEGCATAEDTCTEVDITAVALGKKRLKDQFLPQALLNYCGVDNSFDYSYARIMRIAVTPELQSQGLGQYFIEQIAHLYQTRNTDFIGTSFGVNAPLLNFWQRNAFSLLRIGFKKDKASGEHSALMLKPLSVNHAPLINQRSAYFYQSFLELLPDEFSELPPHLVAIILNDMPINLIEPMSEYEQKALVGFSQQTRLYSDCVLAIKKWLLNALSEVNALDNLRWNNERSTEYALLIAKVLQKNTRETLCRTFNFSGKKMLDSKLKDSLNNLMFDKPKL